MKNVFKILGVVVVGLCLIWGVGYYSTGKCPFASLVKVCDECHCKVDGKCCCNGVCKPKCDCKKCDCKQVEKCDCINNKTCTCSPGECKCGWDKGCPCDCCKGKCKGELKPTPNKVPQKKVGCE